MMLEKHVDPLKCVEKASTWAIKPLHSLADFFMLTKRQEITLKHLNDIGTTKPMDIIKFCIFNLSRPRIKNHRHTPDKRVPGRRHSQSHYQGIIDYLAQNGKVADIT